MRSAAAVVCVLLAGGCSNGCRDHAPATGSGPAIDRTDIVGPTTTQSAIRADVYVDGTVSMEGFASSHTRYVKFLEDIEAALTGAWSSSQVKYFKFGTVVRELPDRKEFLGAATRAFYHEKGLSANTAIDLVIAQASEANLSILITDLFQTEGDFNAMATAVKDYFLKKGKAVGVLAIPSEFDGVVYDARVPAYRYTSSAEASTRRPFYAILVGNSADIERLLDVMSKSAYIDRSLFTLIGPHVISTLR